MTTTSTITTSLLTYLILSLDKGQLQEERKLYSLELTLKRINLYSASLAIRYYLESSFLTTIFNALLLPEKLQELSLFQWLLKRASGPQDQLLSFTMISLPFPK